MAMRGRHKDFSDMSYLLRKLTTKPIWWWERNRYYAIRNRHDRLPSLTVKQGNLRFVVLTTPSTLNDALWSAWSWYRFLRDLDCRLMIVVDGAISVAQRSAAERLFQRITIDGTEWACNYVRPRVPGVQLFFDRHPLGRKLALILALSDRFPLIYSDHDVLAFRRPKELLEAIRGNTPCYFSEEGDGARDWQIAERARQLGFEYAPKFNSGFLYIPQGSLSIRRAGQILATWRTRNESWFSEQTVLSFMLQNIHAEPLPADRYVIRNCRQFYWERDVDYAAITARHFTTPVRHVMYKYGMPLLLRQSREGCCGFDAESPANCENGVR